MKGFNNVFAIAKFDYRVRFMLLVIVMVIRRHHATQVYKLDKLYRWNKYYLLLDPNMDTYQVSVIADLFFSKVTISDRKLFLVKRFRY